MIPSAENSDYPKFVADQVLTSDNLNDLFGYLDEQGRTTRTNLIGMGIVCGLQVKTADDGTSITITKGVGVTSHGYLVSVPEIKYTRRTSEIFDAVKCEYYDHFVTIASKTQKFNLWELKQEAETTNTTALTKSFLQDEDKIVLIFVELLEENNKNCDPDSCDDKGVTVTVNFRPLLASKASVNSFLSNSSNTGVGTALLLPEYKMKRYDVPATLLLDTEDVLQGFRDIITQPFINGIKSGITNAYNTLESILSEDMPSADFQTFMSSRFNALAFLNNGNITQKQAITIQYYYDFFSDLVFAYDELRYKVQAAVCACLPDEDLFPRHLLLGEAIGFSEQDSLYRTRFISSPVLCCCGEERKAVKMLFKRILLLIDNLSIPVDQNNVNNKGIPIKITPSFLGREPLSEKAIPFYYTVDKGVDPLYKYWSPKRAANHTENQVLSYHSGEYNLQDDFVKEPLKFDLEPNNFLRIEGHIGKDYKSVVTTLDGLRKSNRLPFEIVALSSDTRGIFTILDAVKNMETTGSIAAALAEMLKHPCCFADLFLALDSWISRFRCCLASQKRYYLAQPSFEGQGEVILASRTMGSNLSADAKAAATETNTVKSAIGASANTINAAEAEPGTIGELYEARVKAGTIDNQFCNDTFVNIATEKARPGQGLILMPYKIDKVAEILPDHISNLDAVELEKRTNDLTSTAGNMRTLYANPKVSATMQGVDLVQLQSQLQVTCITCLLQELRILIREFLLRLLALMIRQKFGFYVYRNPGIQHKAGVPMGGTFIIVYHEQADRSTENITSATNTLSAAAPNRTAAGVADKRSTTGAATTGLTTGLTTNAGSLSTEQPLLSTILLLEEIQFLQDVLKVKNEPNEILDPLIESLNEGTVIADFYLPYLCCSDCPPTQLLVLPEPIKSNQPPIARPGDNISIELPVNTVVLDGSSSSDPDGIISKYLWEQESGPDATIKSPDESKTEVIISEVGEYVFKLTVTDDKGATNSATVKVTVLAKPNEPPVANAVAKPNVVTLNSDGFASSTLDGTGSKDPDGQIVSYNWSVPSGTNGVTIQDPDKPSTEAIFKIAGSYLFTLTVKDDKGAIGTDTVLVTVNDRANQPPVAKASADPATVILSANGVGISILNGNESFDPDGSIVSFSWVLSGGTGAVIRDPDKPKTEATFNEPGTYEFTLTVKDDRGATASDKVTVSVIQPKNQPPVASASANPAVVTLNSDGFATSTLDGTKSADPDGSIVAFSWTITAGGGATIKSPDKSKTDVQFTKPGIIEFTLMVTDDKGATGTTKVSVTVNDRPNQPPVAKASAKPGIVILPPTGGPGFSQLSADGSLDPDGDPITFKWTTFATGGVIIQSPNAPSTQVTFTTPGVFTFTLTVTDSKGSTGTATVTVTVQFAENLAPTAKATAAPASLVMQPGTTAPGTVQLDGSASSDPEGGALTFAWSVPAGTAGAQIVSPSASKTAVQFTQPGNYVFSLLVKDSKGSSASTTVPVAVSQKIIEQKNCAPASGILSDFAGLKNADSTNFSTFTEVYSDYRDIEAFYKRMNSLGIDSKSPAEQVSFFVTLKIESRLSDWINNLRNLIPERADTRLLCLMMLNIHAELAYFISCIQKDDTDKAEVKMDVSLAVLGKLSKTIQPLVANFSQSQRNVLISLRTITTTERQRVKANGEESLKGRYVNMLDGIISILKSMNL